MGDSSWSLGATDLQYAVLRNEGYLIGESDRNAPNVSPKKHPSGKRPSFRSRGVSCSGCGITRCDGNLAVIPRRSGTLVTGFGILTVGRRKATKAMGRHFVFPVWALVIVAVGCSVSGLSDLDMHRSYASYSDAEADGAVRRGWIPNFVPRLATEIQESHNLDTNEQWQTFRFDIADLPHIQQKLKPAKISEVRFPRSSSTRKRPWWPDDLRGSSSSLVRKYDLYSYEYTIRFGGGPESCTAFVAIEKDTPRAWYWDPR